MDMNDFPKQVGTKDDAALSSSETPTRLSSWPGKHVVHKPTAWKEILEESRECRHPILLSEQGQKVVRAIREIYTARQPLDSQHTPKQGMPSVRRGAYI